MQSRPVCLDAASLADTHAVAAALAPLCRSGDILVLAGEMGAGKTAFAQGFGAALGVTEPVTSPTFTLVQTYRTSAARPLLLHHADIYRLDQLSELADLAVNELAEFGGIVLIEWGDVVAAELGDHLLVALDVIDDDRAALDTGGDETAVPTARRINVSATGPTWAGRWDALLSALNGLELEARPC